MGVRTWASSPGGTLIQSGILAARPAFGVANRYYYATDVFVLFRDTGVAWEKVGGVRYARFVNSLPFYMLQEAVKALDFISLAPVQVAETITVDRLCVLPGTVVAGNIRLGLYNDNGLVPDGGALIVETASVAAAAPGRQEVAIANTRLTPGLYWFAEINDNATLRLLAAWGGSDTSGASPAPHGKSCAQAYGPFTNPCPATANHSFCPVGILRIASIP